ncbi:MAG: DsrE/DsrF/DrsH-like family protein [Nitrospinota bacterium]
MPAEGGGQFVIFAHSGDYDRLYQMATLAVGAAAVGHEVYILLFFRALQKFVEDEQDRMEFPPEYGEGGEAIARRMRESRVPAISQILEAARQAGRVHLYACAAQVKFLGYREEDLAGVVDRVVALPHFLERTRDARTQLFI